MAVYHILIMLLHICTCPDNTVPNHSSIHFVRIYIYGIDLEEVVGFLFVCLFVCLFFMQLSIWMDWLTLHFMHLQQWML